MLPMIGEEKTGKSLQPGTPGASCCAGGYDSGGTNSNLREDDIKKLREERSLFLQKIEPLRQSYYEKAIKLNDELSKKNPNAEITARMQGVYLRSPDSTGQWNKRNISLR